MGKSIKTLDSESIGVGGSLHSRLEEPDLEDKLSSEQLERLMENGSGTLVNKLSQYAELRPTSRHRIAEAFNLYIKRHRGSRIARALGRKVQGIMALEMIEALS